jgi:DNA repair exonuclease SbcCD ATPase subunit
MAVQFVKCIVYKHGLFDNRVLDFSDRLNIVYGKNGSGKSLLVRGMMDAVWGKFSDRKLLSDEAWNSLYLDLLFSLSGEGYYRISNTSDKSYRVQYVNSGGEKTLYSESKLDFADGKIQNDFNPDFESKVFREFLNRIDAGTFINSSFIPASTDIAGNSIIDYPVLKKIILNDITGFYNNFINLNRAFQQGAAAPGGLPPEVVRFEDKKRELEKKIQIIDISDSRHEKLRKEKNTVQQEIDELNNSLNSLNSQKEILNKIIENLTKVDELKNEFETIKDEIQREQQKIKSISDMKTELDALFPQFSDIDLADSTNLDRLQEVFNDIRNLNETIDDFYFMRELRSRKFKRIALAVGAAALSGVCIIFVKNGFDVFKDAALWAGILGLSIAVEGAIALYLMIARRSKLLARLEDERKQYKEKIMALMEKSKVELEDYKLTEIYELLLQYFEDYVNYTERKKDLARIKSSLKEEEYMITIQKKLDALKKEEEIIKDEIHTSIDTLNIVDDIENETSKIEDLIQNIDVEAAIIKEKIETKEHILQQIDGEFAQVSGDDGAMSAIMEEKNNLDRMMKKWRVNRNSLQFISRTLASAVERSEEKQLRMLTDGTIDKFNHLTGNQFITKIDAPVLMGLLAENRITEDLTPPVIHAILISLKFTLSDFIINGDCAIPLLIDEPFQFMDDERCNKFRDLVSYISNKRQVIIFTHHSDKRNWGNFIEL